MRFRQDGENSVWIYLNALSEIFKPKKRNKIKSLFSFLIFYISINDYTNKGRHPPTFSFAKNNARQRKKNNFQPPTPALIDINAKII